ncbi:dihydrolipoyllysine-residue acetyltransferase [Legionella impletisoli]|uniref:Acetyltransferase component of pyruvate dehydrogenase complex n=1 Tax=Legionella impletisoli TaxID=343510 RepID=A0A917JPZ4_9GAMM|nr:dihydrolipoyllysine-residue acetyltransferase [Legionella impletisoli]GGI77943.1 acetyltransferase component of pyruvate dehydrogenase complex [Legionella impletisoli]
MADDNKITVPDIGGAADVDVIEILVKSGDEISKDTPLITLESDKASMDIPSPKAGKVKAIELNVGDKVSEGDLILTLEEEKESSSEKKKEKKDKESEEKKAEPKSNKEMDESKEEQKSFETKSKEEIKVPDIGGATQVEVIEIFVKTGDTVSKDDSIITLESDKASMEIPCPNSGVVQEMHVKVGDKVSEGDLILILETTDKAAKKPKSEEEPKKKAESEKEQADILELKKSEKQVPGEPSKAFALPSESLTEIGSSVFAGPAVRRLARELGVDLKQVKGTGRKSRISKEDVQEYVKARLQDKSAVTGLSLPPSPSIDFSKFGETEIKPLNKIKRLTGENVHRSWLTIPHVTQFDEADITELEAFRKKEAEQAKNEGYKLTLLAFVCKAVSKALVQFPQFNTSLDPSGEQLIYKKYCNIGVAVETPNGLVVPVIKNVDKLSVSDIAKEMSRLSAKAREKGLMPADMSGGCFTISSLGGIGGTAFTPIVNSPEVAILGLSRSVMKPVYRNKEFEARLMLPLSLSYDHRVIDGAEAARFTRYLCEALEDIRKILL